MNASDSKPIIDSLTNNYLKHLSFFIKHRRTDRDFRMNFHTHNGYELYFVHEGVGSFIIDGRIYPFQPYDLLLIPANVIHKSVPSTGGMPFTRTVINFMPEFVQSSARVRWLDVFQADRQPERLHIRLGDEQYNRLAPFLDRMSEEYAFRERGFEQMLGIYLNRLLDDIYGFVHALRDSESAPPAALVNETVENVIQYLSEHYSENITLDDLAKKFYVTPYYLCHLFKKTTGDTISKFVLYIRIHYAKQRLLDSDTSIADIAAELGFNSYPYFGMVFKKHENMTPKQYRQTYKHSGLPNK